MSPTGLQSKSGSGSKSGSKSSKGGKFNPKLAGPGTVVEVLLECFEDGRFPCSMAETAAAAYKNKDTDSKLGGKHTFIFNQSGDDADEISRIGIEDGIVGGNEFGTPSSDFGNDSDSPARFWYDNCDKDSDDSDDARDCDGYMVYCCGFPQFQAGGQEAD